MKLQSIKSWHNLDEAANYLSLASSSPINSVDVLHFIAEGILKPSLLLIHHPARKVEPTGLPNAFLQDTQEPANSHWINAVCLWKSISNVVTYLDGIYNLDTRADVMRDYLRAILVEHGKSDTGALSTLVVESANGEYFQLLIRNPHGEPMKLIHDGKEIEVEVFYDGLKGYIPKKIEFSPKDIVISRLDIEEFISRNISEHNSATQKSARSRKANCSSNEDASAPTQMFGENTTFNSEARREIAKIPGKMPKNFVNRLAVKAAWELECTGQRRAAAKEVMALLQHWAEKGTEPAVLKRSEKGKRSVIWLTDKGVEREYSLGACERTLQNWNESRR